jgi:phospholipid transport system substrate-binding protein
MGRALRWAALAGGLLIASLGSAQATGDAPRSVVEAFHATLLQVMKQASQLGFQGRYKTLQPAIENAFNLPLMARLAIGPQWTSIAPEQQQRLIEGFRRLTFATYASRFDSYDGEQFETKGEKSGGAGGGTLVETRLVPQRGNGDPVDLSYLVRQDGGRWQIIDVFLSGTISELATRRAEFTSVLRRDGAEGLTAMLERKVAELTPR